MHATSSPKYSQANGTPKPVVKTVKQFLTKYQDLHLATYRSIEWLQPSRAVNGPKLYTTFPMLKKQLHPNLPNVVKLQRKEKKMRNRMKRKRHGDRNLKPLSPGDTVWIPEREAEGTVQKESITRVSLLHFAADHGP